MHRLKKSSGKMALLSLLPFLLNICLLNEVNSYSYIPDYDMMVVAEMWPQTACWVINDKWQYDNCSLCNYVPKSSINWTMHGLWPSNRDGDHPFYCDDTKKFDVKLLGGRLTSKMNEKWPTFDIESNNTAFWKHEWDKHGTCAANVESVNNVPRYFSKTLDLMDEYNIGDILEISGIVPRDDPYEIDDIVLAIEGVLGVHVSISCAANEINQMNYLDQVYICFDKNLSKLIDCDETTEIDCSYGNQVIYPEILKPC